MNVLVFHIGPERYALPLASVARVLPAARLKALPGAPDYVAGLLDLHGEPVPVIDLSRLAGCPAEAIRYDTRILLVDLPVAGAVRRLGLQAERVAGVEALAGAPLDPGVLAAPWLGAVAHSHTGGASGLLQLIEPARLLAPEVAALLFGSGAAA
jgi:chemotaxis-related protein WspB